MQKRTSGLERVSVERLPIGDDRYDSAAADASSPDQDRTLVRTGNWRIRPVSGIRSLAEVKKFKATRKVFRNVDRFAIQKLLKSIVGFANSSADHVFLILAGKLAASNQQEVA